jgi:hypothetical protein
MSEQKTYIPKSSAKEVQFRNGGSILKVGLHVESMIAFLQTHLNEAGYVNLGISRRREVGSHGDTHCVWLDTWKPDMNKMREAAGAPMKPVDSQPKPADDDSDSVPF